VNAIPEPAESPPTLSESVGEVRRESWDYVSCQRQHSLCRRGVENRYKLVEQASKHAKRHTTILWLSHQLGDSRCYTIA
jgi:hypothetical protein